MSVTILDMYLWPESHTSDHRLGESAHDKRSPQATNSRTKNPPRPARMPSCATAAAQSQTFGSVTGTRGRRRKIPGRMRSSPMPSTTKALLAGSRRWLHRGRTTRSDRPNEHLDRGRPQQTWLFGQCSAEPLPAHDSHCTPCVFPRSLARWWSRAKRIAYF